MNTIFRMLLVLSLASCATPKTNPSTEKPSRLLAELTEFVNATAPNRSAGQLGHEKASKWIEARFRELSEKIPGAKVYRHSFYPDVAFAEKNYRSDFVRLVAKKFPKKSETYLKWKAFTDSAIQFVKQFEKVPGQNWILEIPGATEPRDVLYIGGHYDTITHDHQTMKFTVEGVAPGADDNASGFIAMLSLAEYFAAHPPSKTLRFVAFDDEEIFFLGSYAFAKDYLKKKLPFSVKKERYAGLINLEMIGWSTLKTRPNVPVKIYTRANGQKGAKNDEILADMLLKQTPAPGVWNLKPEILKNGFDRSDQWSFWQKGLSAVCISEDWENDFNEKNYHTANDTPATLNDAYLNAVTEWVKSGVIAWTKDSKK